MGKDRKRETSQEAMAIIQERNHTAGNEENSSGDGKKRSDFTLNLTEFAKGLDVGCKTKDDCEG